MLPRALVSDIAYAMTDDAFFARMALWMVTSGLITGVLGGVTGAVDFVALERPRTLTTGWVHAAGNGVALVLDAASLFGRMLGGEEFVSPGGWRRPRSSRRCWRHWLGRR